MQNTGVSAIDTTIQKTNIWFKDIMEQLDWDDKQRVYQAVRAVLHTIRDRLTVEEATDLGAQLPMLIRGFYYDGWNPSANPVKFNKAEFLSAVGQHLPAAYDIDEKKITGAVLRVIDKHIAEGEIKDIKAILPHELTEFWNSQTE